MVQSLEVQLNYRLLIGTFLATMISGVSVVQLYFQRQTAIVEGLQQKVDNSLSDGDYQAAYRDLSVLTKLLPQDSIRKIQLADSADKVADDSNEINSAMRLSSHVLGICLADPTLGSWVPSIRKRLLKRHAELGNFEEVIDLVSHLVGPEVDLELQRHYAVAKARLWLLGRDYDLKAPVSEELPEWFHSLLSIRPLDLLVATNNEIPEDFEIAALLADLCLGESSKLAGSFLAGQSGSSLQKRAREITEELTERRKSDPFAWLLRYEVESRIGKPEPSVELLERAIDLAAQDTKVCLVAGKLYLDKAKSVVGDNSEDRKTEYLARSEKVLELAREQGAKDVDLYVLLGDIAMEKGQPEEAIALWQSGRKTGVGQVGLLDYRIVQTLIQRGELKEARKALEVMDEGLSSQRAKLDRTNRMAHYRKAGECWAEYHLACGNYLLATDSLNEILANSLDLAPADKAAVIRQTGDIYRKIGQHDQAVLAYKNAFQLVPNNAEYRRVTAMGLLSAGRLPEAYKQMMLIEPKNASDWLQICSLILLNQRVAEPDSGYWYSFDKGIEEIKRFDEEEQTPPSNKWFVELMQLEASVLRSGEEERSTLIEDCSRQAWSIVEREKFDLDVVREAVMRWKVWGKQEYLGKIAKAIDVLEDRPKKPSETAQILILTGDLSAAKSHVEQALKEQPQDKEVRKLASLLAVESLPVIDAIKSIRGFQEEAWLVAKHLAARKLKSLPEVEGVRNRGAKINDEQVESLIEDLKALEGLLQEFEGQDGTEWRYVRGRRLLAEASLAKEINEIELFDTASFLDLKRPEWSETYLLAALVAEWQGDRKKAIRAYSKALTFGNSEIETHERLIGLLYKEGFIAEIRMALNRLGDRAFASRPIAAVSLLIDKDNTQDQLATAEAGTRMRPQDPMAWVWCAQVTERQSRMQTGEKRVKAIESAKEMFAKATEVASKQDLRIPMAKFNFHQAIGDEPGQHAVMEEIEESRDFEPLLKTITIGQMHELLGDTDNAIASYRRAVELGADEQEFNGRIVELLIRDNRLEDAIAALDEQLQRHPEDTTTRRKLAVLLANRSFEDDWHKVGQLLSQSERATGPEDIRLQVALLIHKNSLSHLKQAKSLLEKIAEVPGVGTEEDQVQLAALNLRIGRTLKHSKSEEAEDYQAFDGEGERLLKMVSNVVSPAPEHVYAYADYLIGQNRLFDAVEESRKLVALAPDAFPTALLSARISKLLGNAEAAKQTIVEWIKGRQQIEGFAGDMKKLATHLVQAGQALQMLDEPLESKKYFEEAFRIDKRSGLSYVRSILSTEDVALRDNAIRFLMEILEREGTNESALLLSLLIRKSDTQKELIAEAQKRLVDFSLATQDDREQIQSMADLWVWRGDEDQAIETFRRIVQNRPNDVVALNNLAMLLADTEGGAAEALKYVDRAIQLIGAQAALLDSKAYVLLRMGKLPESISILTQLHSKNSTPSVRLHLYQALKQSRQSEQAKGLLPTIDPKVLRKTPLTQRDYRELEEIEKALAR